MNVPPIDAVIQQYNFARFLQDPYFWQLLRNTFTISLLTLVFSFPAPILLALLLNEIRVRWFKRTVQTISYMPHFIAMVVACAMIKAFCQTNGIFNDIIALFGGTRANLLSNTSLFYPIYILSGIWQGVGWNSIIYVAAISGIDQEMYESASLDGAGRWKKLIYITLPSIAPTIILLLILNMGNMLNIGYEKVILMYNSATYSTADIFSTYVYRQGLLNAQYSFASAVGLANSAVNVVILLGANFIARKTTETSIF